MPPTNLLTPFRRDRKRDFAADAGRALIRSKVLQVLLTEGDTPQASGELPWRTAFGSGLHLLRHQRNDEVLAELARVRVRDALQRWLPGVGSVRVTAQAEENELVVHLQLGADRLDVRISRSRRRE